MHYLSNDIARIKEDTKKFDKENGILNKDFNDAHKELEELEDNYAEAKGEYENL